MDNGLRSPAERESGADRLLGDMVRALPRSPAAGEEHRKEVRGAAAGSAERQWKDFITKNEMTWPQYRDGGFTGPLAKMFGVDAIPHTFTVDADGVLQDEH